MKGELKIRVVHLVYSFATGGMEKGICTTIRHGSAGFEHVVICLTTSGEMVRYLPEKTLVLALGKKPGNSLLFLLRLAKLLRRFRPAVIHTRNWSGLDGVFAARLAGIKSVVHGEHGWGMADPYGLNSKRRYIRRAADLGVHKYTCVSKQMKTWLDNQIHVKKPISQIYNGIDAQQFHPATEREKIGLRQKFRLPNASPVIGVVGRLDPIKNHRLLFDAYTMLKPHYPEMRLLVVGDGPERKGLEKIATEGIRFLGRIEDMCEIYRLFDIFVLPSNNEGISNTILEAMASGLPVIASHVGGTPELIEHGINGLLFPLGDVTSLADRIRAYSDNPAIAASHGIKARKTVETNFTIGKMVSSYENVWKTTWSRVPNKN